MKTKMLCMVAVLVLVFSLAAALAPSGTAKATTFFIPDGDVNALIAAINTSNVNGVPDTINLAVNGTYTINTSDSDTDGPNGLPSINSSITINGNGATIQRSSAGGTLNFRIFHVAATGNVSMSGMTIRNGNTTSDGGGIYNDGGNVTMTSCTISDNTAGDDGGGLYNNDYGNVTMTGCTVSGNTVEGAGKGGGIYSDTGDLTMTDCTVSSNTAQDNGGIYSGGPLTMTNCTVSGNTATRDMAGIYNHNATMTNCTVSGNTADGEAGGIYSDGTLELINCTISGNTANTDGGGIFNYGGKVIMMCTILYGNSANVSGNNIYNISGGFYTATESIVDEPLGSAPNPLLGPLQDNGGPTETHALLAGSPAIDGCTGGNCTVDTDQRGITRPQLIACDVGAYEYEQQYTVGGLVEPVDRIGILAPWLGLVALIVVAITTAVVIRRRAA